MTSCFGQTSQLSRRRFISMVAAASGAGALSPRIYAREIRQYIWRGIALGAEASLVIEHHDETAAKEAIAASVLEVARLEKVFSLHISDSALVRLNRQGLLEEAPDDLRLLVSEALALARSTDGAFDPTIQPLWALHARHFSAPDAHSEGPAEVDIAAARARSGWEAVVIEGARLSFAKPGMALTLNGIAQGYITDRIGALLRARGFENVLVSMGEHLALGPKRTGNPWTVGIGDPEKPADMIARVPLSDGALATSGGYGTTFDAARRHSHILDPRTGRPAQGFATVTVLATRASVADGLSTALAAARPEEAAGFLGRYHARAYAVPFGKRDGYWI